jgi:hypothetical protein
VNLRPTVMSITAIVLAALPLQAQEIAYEGGMAVTTGSYFYATRTTSWTIATGITYTTGPLVLRATAPVYVQNSSLFRGFGAGMMPSGGMASGGGVGNGMSDGGGMMGGASSTTDFHAAVGDPTVQAAWRALSGGPTALTVGAGVKVPATEPTNYGTGKWDVGGTLTLTQRAGAGMLFGLDLSYWHLGDLPAFDFRDPVAATVSAGKVFADTWGVSLLVTGGTSVLPGHRGPVSVGAALAQLGNGRLWGLFASLGLTETAPDLSIGATWRIGL